MTGASVNFKTVKSAGHAVSHASREVAPTYLLPTDNSMGTVVLLDDKGRVSQVLDAKMALASPRAKVDQRYSPVWEGILNLRRPEAGEDPEVYRAECSAVVTDWYKQYEVATGHKVLRVDMHLDEGHMVDGEAVLNAHAHVIADRTNDLGRVIKLSPKQLRELQTMTAEITQLERGKSSFETGRKHISHQAYKYLAELGRLETQKQVDVEKDTTKMYGGLVDTLNSRSKDQVQQLKEAKAKTENLQAKLDGEPARLDAALKEQEARLNEKYRLDREAMKASGTAKQADYQALKKAKDEEISTLKTQLDEALTQAAKVPKLEADAVQAQAKIAQLTQLAEQVPELKKTLAEAKTEAAKVPDLVEQLRVSQELGAKVPSLETQAIQQASELAQLNDQYQRVKEALKESGEAKQADDQSLKKTHEKALADLTKAQTEAGKVSGLEAQIDQLTPQAAKVPGLEKDLTATRTEAAKVPSLEAQATGLQAQIDLIKPLANAVPELVFKLKTANEQVKKMDEYTKTINAKLAASNEKIATELIAKAKAIEDLVQAGVKSDALLVTAEGHRAAAEKLTGKLAVSEEKVTRTSTNFEALKVKANVQIGDLTAENTQLAADLAAANLLVEGFKQAQIDKPDLHAPKKVLEAVDTILIDQARQRIKTPVEPQKAAQAPTAPAIHEKSLVERIEDWVKGLIEKFGKQPSALDEGSSYVGKVIAVMDGAWAQKVTREGNWVVHQGQAPALESIAEVTFKGGESKVKGMEKSGKGGIGG